jgi:hypothetical protein
MRLDFNKDGSVSIDDVRQGLKELYEFLKSYDYIEATTRIKSSVYEEARRYLQTSGQHVLADDDVTITGDVQVQLKAGPEQKLPEQIKVIESKLQAPEVIPQNLEPIVEIAEERQSKGSELDIQIPLEEQEELVSSGSKKNKKSKRAK